MFYCGKKMLIEIDYDNAAFHLIDSLRNLERADYLGFNDVFDSVNMYFIRSKYIPNITDSALTTNLAIEIDTTEEITTGIGSSGYALNENTMGHGLWTILPSEPIGGTYEV
ncbi:hypothetical protein DRP44_01700 [candidate division TA06 bacterium]|uniref:Uncharacterized protein n=1 Tax=candidate division TA06 bacterium TaxID=2250710 RepID=A0A660SC38_UNCT6|nr:MAG: hypothetical protein DRP44_01700 [candidate division TA06 bacterium]